MRFCLLFFCLLSALGSALESQIHPLKSASDLSFIDEFFNDEPLILLGESSHGTSEYYLMRAKITKQLIKQGSISFVAVEGDWAPIAHLNRYVLAKTDSSAREIMQNFDRWPTWLWANEEFLLFVEWLREYNDSVTPEQRVGLYGIDVYGQWQAMDELKSYISQNFADELPSLVSHLSCFGSFDRDEQLYAAAVARRGASCQSSVESVVQLLVELDDGSLEHFSALQNARAIKGSERFFRLSVRRGPAAWNSRAEDFFNNVMHIKNFYGEGSRAVVWAHNTHVGDSRATSMAQQRQINIGSLARQFLGADNVRILGFSTAQGTVVAGRDWGGSYQVMDIPSPQPGSLESYFADQELAAFFVNLSAEFAPESLLASSIPHRAIGVLYRPENERGNYVATVTTQRYDGMVFLKSTEALEPIN